MRKLPSQDEISLNDDAGKLQGMLSLCDDNVRQELINSMFNKIPIFATLPDKMNLNTTGSFDKSQTVSLLYHLGYLTIEHERSQEEGITSFVIPNKVYETLFLDYCRLAMGYRPNLNIDLSSMYGKSADIKLLLNTISEQIEKKLNPQSLARFSEMALQLICDNIINNSIKRHLCSYTEFYTGNGYADILVTNTCPDGHYFLFEFKYLPKNKNTPASIKSKSAEAYNELETYRHGSLLKEKLGSHILDCYIIVFVGSECKLFQKV